ncbi:MAG: hypothetical protein GXO21_05110 [Aquificae bacterium]|nr:hypothetical protein [Aquificota bacterium]
MKITNFIKKLIFVAPAVIFFLISCEKSNKPVPINYGVDECAHCRMKITDPRYGSELLLKTGKPYKFDSIECLAAFYIENKEKLPIVYLWVPDFLTKTFIEAPKAYYLHSKNLPSPMSLNISAHKTKENLEKVKSKYGGEELDWQGVLNLVKKEWIEKKDKVHSHH